MISEKYLVLYMCQSNRFFVAVWYYGRVLDAALYVLGQTTIDSGQVRENQLRNMPKAIRKQWRSLPPFIRTQNKSYLEKTRIINSDHYFPNVQIRDKKTGLAKEESLFHQNNASSLKWIGFWSGGLIPVSVDLGPSDFSLVSYLKKLHVDKEYGCNSSASVWIYNENL